MSVLNKINYLRSLPSGYIQIPFKNAFQPYFILFVVSVLLNINTLKNEVAFDDESVLHKNEYVMMGFKGITGILTHDSYYSYYKQLGIENTLPGGRYRPLSQVSFAIEQEFIGTIPDGIVKDNSWDINGNQIKDPFEDTNGDGLFNDYDFWSKGAGIRHLINVLLYALTILIIYHVLSNYFFSSFKDSVFFALVIFALHPMHTEVVANIKSRDEILSLLFIFLTLFFSVKYLFSPNMKNFIGVGLCMLLSLLSKEYALILFALIPSLIFVYYKEHIDLKNKILWIIMAMVACSSYLLVKFFNSGTLIAVPVLFSFAGYYVSKMSKQKIVNIVFILGASLLVYLALRFSATTHDVEIATFENDILANPYQFANATQEIASKIAVWLKYLVLFIFPNPLVSDYSYNSIPYSDFTSCKVWLSLIIFSLLFVFTLISVLKKSKISLALLLSIGFFLPVMNLFINIGATMGERLFFHASLGFCLLLSFCFFSALKRFGLENNSSKYTVVILIAVSLIFGILTFNRNFDWKNNKTLFLSDVEKVPENINILTGAGAACFDLSVLPINKDKRKYYGNLANGYYNRGIKLYPKHYPLYMNKAVNHMVMGELDSSKICTDSVLKYAPTLPNVHKFREKLSEGFMLQGVSFYQTGKKKNGMESLLKSLAINKKNTKAWNNLGKALLSEGATEKALMCYKTTLNLDPKNLAAINAIASIDSISGKINR